MQMVFIDALYKSTFYLLTYLLTYLVNHNDNENEHWRKYNTFIKRNCNHY